MRSTLLISLLFVCSCVTAQVPFVRDSLDTYVNREMKRWQVPGLALVVVKDGKVAAMKGYGVREVGKPEKVNENTLFQIASNTKALTGTCVALLNHQKKLSLDDKVTKWLPYFRLFDTLATRELTVRDVLCHRVGFQTFQGDFLHWNSNLSTDYLLRNLHTLKPVHSFRSRWGYYNMGFVTAGEVIKAVTDTSWQDYITTHLLKPLQMTRSSPHFDFIRNDKNAAKCYTLKNNSLVEVPYANIDNIGASASISSCVKDLANWMIMNMDSGKFSGQRVLPYAVIREAQRSQSLVSDLNNPDNPTAHFLTYGLGWFMQDFNGRKIVRHGGGTNGFVTLTLMVPEEKLGIVVLTNTDANELYNVLPYQIVEAYLNMPYRNLSAKAFARNQKSLEEEKKVADSLLAVVASKPKSALPLAAYAGSYNNSFYGSIEVKNENGKLNVFFPHHNVTGTLERLGGNNFLCTYSDITWGVQQMPFKVAGEHVVGMTVKVNDFIDYMSYDFTRVP